MTAVAGVPVPLRFVLEPGDAVDAAIAKGFAASGCVGGIVAFHGGRFEPFQFVMPAASPDASHAAWYSDTFAPAGPVEIRRGCAIVGERDGRLFIHCHGIWASAEGVHMGHMLAPNTIVAEPIEVTGIGTKAATFRALHDPETNFTLFEPVPASEPRQEGASSRVLLAKVRPNKDISLALEEICSQHGITKARIHGIGSLNGVRFTDGSCVESHATEVLIREGRVEPSGDALRAFLRIDVVDPDGRIFSGDLVHGDNPVCVTFELMIESVA
jgi:predicted DNA-binding protein with PD1-like motif